MLLVKPELSCDFFSILLVHLLPAIIGGLAVHPANVCGSSDAAPALIPLIIINTYILSMLNVNISQPRT